MSQHIRLLALLLACAAASSCREAPVADPQPPKNLLIVLMDATAATHLHEWGYRRDPAPNLGKLGKEGVLFLNAHSQAANTNPSVWSFFTGRYPYIPGAGYTMHHPAEHDVTMADAFRAAGFRTGAVSESPWIAGKYGWGKGFDSFKDVPALFDQDISQERWSRDPGATQRAIDHTKEWIAAQGDARWFCYLHLERPHDPYDPPEPFASRYGGPHRPDDHPRSEGRIRMAARDNPATITAEDIAYMVNLYDSNIRYVDALVGKLMKWLDESGLRENTLVVFMSDHGEAFWEHEKFGHNTTLFEEMIKVPLIFVAPKSAGFARGQYSHPVELVDLMPTISEIFGLNSSAPHDGVSLVPALRGAKTPVRTEMHSYSAFDLHRYAYRSGNLKLIAQLDPQFQQFLSVELYDLARDPLERNNLAGNETLLAPLREVAAAHLAAAERRDTTDDPQLHHDTREQLCAMGYFDCD